MREVSVRAADVILTLDETIQWRCEQILFEECEKSSAKAGMVVVMDPGNGEILSLANYPPFDPGKKGEYAKRGEMSRARNNCITSVYEPGSTMKPIIAAIGLDSGAITSDSQIDCENGARWGVRGRRLPITDEHSMGIVSVTEVLVHSSNIGIGKVAERIVEHTSKGFLSDRLHAFGVAGRSGIDLPGESPCVLRSWENWKQNDLLVLAFGNGPVMVHALGLAKAYSVLVNGGWDVTPHIIRGYVGSRNQKEYINELDSPTRLIHQDVSDRIRKILGEVVVRGTGKKARSDWYTTGGKTGTSKKVVGKVYSQDHRVLSFIGFSPVENPEIVVAVALDEPQGYRFGGQIAAPIFKRIVEETLPYLHVPPDLPGADEDLQPIARSETMPANESNQDLVPVRMALSVEASSPKQTPSRSGRALQQSRTGRREQ